MKITGCINDFHLAHGESYHVMTDGEYDYQVSPDSEKTVFIGMIEWTKYRHDGIIQTRYVKGFIVPFSDRDPVTGKTVKTVDEVTHSLIILMMENPDKFEELFLKKAKPAKGKKAKYPKISKSDIKDIIWKNHI